MPDRPLGLWYLSTRELQASGHEQPRATMTHWLNSTFTDQGTCIQQHLVFAACWVARSAAKLVDCMLQIDI